jgi:hypothetical protein
MIDQRRLSRIHPSRAVRRRHPRPRCTTIPMVLGIVTIARIATASQFDGTTAAYRRRRIDHLGKAARCRIPARFAAALQEQADRDREEGNR